MSRGKGDVAVGDRLMVTVTTARPGTNPSRYDYDHGRAEVVTEVVTVDEVTSMGCGHTRAGFARPYSEGGPCPRVHVFSHRCTHSGGDDLVDFDEARAQADEASRVPVQGVLL